MKIGMMKVALLVLALICGAMSETLVTAGAFQNIYNTSGNSVTLPEYWPTACIWLTLWSWYINDHTLVYGPGNVWHMFGITHTEPADPELEVNFAHATSSSVCFLNWAILTLAVDKFHTKPFCLWYLTYCLKSWNTFMGTSCHLSSTSILHVLLRRRPWPRKLSSQSRPFERPVQLETIRNFIYRRDWWKGKCPIVRVKLNLQDPMVMNLGPDFDNQWVIYYCGTNPDKVCTLLGLSLTTQLDDNVTHVTYYRTSSDLLKWSEPGIAFVGGVTGSSAGGPTESPFVVMLL